MGGRTSKEHKTESRNKTEHQRLSNKIQQVLENENLVRKEITEEQDSLFKAFSDGLYFTPNYYHQIKDLCIRYLSDLITTNTLPAKLEIFRGNLVLWNDYSKNPSSPDFYRLNIELFSLAFDVRVVVYSVSSDGMLNAKIFNNKFDKTVQFLNTHDTHLDVIYTLQSMQITKFCQDIALNIIDRVLAGKHDTKDFEWKDFSKDKFITSWTHAKTSSGKITPHDQSIHEIIEESEEFQEEPKKRHSRRRNSDSSLKSFKTDDTSSQLEFYRMFVGLKPNEDFSKQVEKDISKLGQLADMSLINESRLSVGGLSSTSDGQPSLALTHGRSFPNQRRIVLSEEDDLEDLAPPEMVKLEKSRSCIDPKQQKSAVHFANIAPPGLTPNRYTTKTYGSESFTQAAAGHGDYQPRHRFSESGSHIGSIEPPNLNKSKAVMRNSEEINKTHGNAGNAPQTDATTPQTNRAPNPKLSLSDKKKPVIIEESQHRYTGRLKFFDEGKNYGFIVMDDDGSDIFVHYDDLHKANINKEFLKSAKFGNSVRLSFSCMEYIGKYNKSRKATDIQFVV